MTLREMRAIPTYIVSNGYRVIYQDDYENCLDELKDTIDFEKHREYVRGLNEGKGDTTTTALKQELTELRAKYIKLLEYTGD